MPDLPFPDLATSAARETQPPPFEEIVGRAKRRRRRGVLSAAATTLGVLALVATGAALAGHDRDAAPPVVEPSTQVPSGSAGPSRTPDPAPDADIIVRTGHLVSYAPGADGALLTVWQTCTSDELQVCHAAWQVQTADGVRRGLAPGDGPSAISAGGAFVLKDWNRSGTVIAADGTVTALLDGSPRPVTSGDALLYGRKGLLVVDARTARTWPLSRDQGVDRWVTGTVAEDGTAWATAAVGGEVWLGWNRGGSWRHHVMPADQPRSLPGYLAVAGDHVASVSGYDGATILPVADFAVTTDGGSTWHDLHQRDLPFTFVDAVAATAGGTLYVITEDGHGGRGFFRTTDRTWTHFAEVPNPHHLDVLVPAGDRVLAQGGSDDSPALFALDDSGRATPVPLTR